MGEIPLDNSPVETHEYRTFHTMVNLAAKLEGLRLGKLAARTGQTLLFFALHTVAVYVLIRWITPPLADLTHGKILPIFLRRAVAESSIQFFASHLFLFSFLPALVGGIAGAKLFVRGARFAWIIPVIGLGVGFFFSSPTIYPTSMWDSDFGPAMHQYFGGGFHIPAIRNYKDLAPNSQALSDIFRASLQFRTTAPAYSGVGYSLGAWLYVLILKMRTGAHSRETTDQQVS